MRRNLISILVETPQNVELCTVVARLFIADYVTAPYYALASCVPVEGHLIQIHFPFFFLFFPSFRPRNSFFFSFVWLFFYLDLASIVRDC